MSGLFPTPVRWGALWAWGGGASTKSAALSHPSHISFSPLGSLLVSIPLLCPHPFHLFPSSLPSQLAAVFQTLSATGLVPTCLCHPTLGFPRASCSWPGHAWVWHILHMFFPNSWPLASPRLYFAKHFFSLHFQSLVYFKRIFNPSVSGSFAITVTHQNLVVRLIWCSRSLMNLFLLL